MSAPAGRRLLYVLAGADLFLADREPVAAAARAAGYEIHVAVPDGPQVADVAARGYTVHSFSLRRASASPLAALGSIRSLAGLYRRVRPDVVHHYQGQQVVFGGVASRLARVPAVVNSVTGLGGTFAEGGGVAQAALRRAILLGFRFAFAHPNQRLIVQNPDDGERLVAHAGARRSEVRVVRGSGVDPRRFAPAGADGCHEEHQPLRVLLASRMLWDKGIREFVDAARALRGEGCDARFVLVGDPDDANAASVPRGQLQAWHDEGVVEWWGYSHDMAATWREADVACLPSAYPEGVPKTLIEAASTGLPLVTTDAPGCREIARQGENGLLVGVRDTRALTDALRTMLTDTDLRRRMGRRSREIVLTEFAIEHVVRQTVDVYAEVVR